MKCPQCQSPICRTYEGPYRATYTCASCHYAWRPLFTTPEWVHDRLPDRFKDLLEQPDETSMPEWMEREMFAEFGEPGAES